MKLDNAEADVESVLRSNEDEASKPDAIRFHCRNCAAPTVPLKEMAIQCELLKGNQQESNLLTINGSRRGSAHSITEIRADVPFDEDVSTAVETPPAPDEILLVTRSFENEAQPVVAPRRSSIAQFFNNMKSIGNRKSEPDLSGRGQYLNQDAASAPHLRSGIRRGSVGVGLDMLSETPSEESSYGELHIREPGQRRHSVQVSNGQIVEEDIEECGVDSSVHIDDSGAPGEINIMTRCFETTEAPRRESIIDKLNFVKMIGKSRKRSKEQQCDTVQDDEEPPTRYLASSGVRRKSIAPASMAYISEDDADQVDSTGELEGSMAGASGGMAGLAAPEASDVQAARYVTSGIRRGSVAAVSAAPPCRGMGPATKQTNGAMLEPEDEEERMRYVTSGIRRGSVAAVSAAPPCRNPEEESSSSNVTLLPEFPGASNQSRRGSYERIETYQMDPGDQDVLRSGVRRRSLTPAADGALIAAPVSPMLDRSITYNPLANETIYSSGDESDPTDDEPTQEISNASIQQVSEKKPLEGKKRKKAVNTLFESLTGREAGVDYTASDAEAIERNRIARDKKTSIENASIPQIKLSFDESNSDKESDANANEDHQEFHQQKHETKGVGETGEEDLKSNGHLEKKIDQSDI